MISRRRLLTDFLAVFAEEMAMPQGETVDPRRWLRPPGALPEEEFLAACTRCTDCIEACPHAAIRRLGPEFGACSATPAIIPEEAPCYLCDELPCIAACTPGALASVATKSDVRMGTAVLDREACYVAQGQPCDYCFTCCPVSRDVILPDPNGIPRIDAGRCVGCAVCAFLCPADALRIV